MQFNPKVYNFNFAKHKGGEQATLTFALSKSMHLIQLK
jgi:outer membrane phospholipase A